ncbi:hypothetical protein ZIOFF_019049 [Zingiber officinale]|uniref:Pentatricopeptide repeat-containing protein n=1 Tax=Zingiber officinale TaxID=94328 RepID=A0A8J5H6P9_ZINOF|nr:hypothetical protein ZIOFF_019049 [Zingiber officinale]
METNRTLTSLLNMGLVPDQEIYLILIDGYGTTGDYQKIIILYYEMVHMGLEPNVRFYKSLVQNLCKYGQMSDAEKFIGILGQKGSLLVDFLNVLKPPGHVEKKIHLNEDSSQVPGERNVKGKKSPVNQDQLDELELAAMMS